MLDRAALSIYFLVFISLIAAGLGFPIPEELPIVTAGGLVGHAAEDPNDYRVHPEYIGILALAPEVPFPASLPWNSLRETSEHQEPPPPRPTVRLLWWIMLPLCILGVVISDGLLYGMGRLFGSRLLETRWMRRIVSPEKRQRIEQNFHRYGVLVLLFARFLPTIRSPIFIMAGVMRVPFTRFVMADGLYAIPGVSLLFFLAFWFGDQVRDLVLAAEGRVAAFRPILILLALAGVAAYLFYHFLRHPVATGDPREELPVIGGQVAAKIKCPDDEPPILTPSGWTCPDGSPPKGADLPAEINHAPLSNPTSEPSNRS